MSFYRQHGFSRRHILASASAGFGMLALRAIAGMQLHHSARVTNVIVCFMDGGPSHVDTFYTKAMLMKHESEANCDIR